MIVRIKKNFKPTEVYGQNSLEYAPQNIPIFFSILIKQVTNVYNVDEERFKDEVKCGKTP